MYVMLFEFIYVLLSLFFSFAFPFLNKHVLPKKKKLNITKINLADSQKITFLTDRNDSI